MYRKKIRTRKDNQMIGTWTKQNPNKNERSRKKFAQTGMEGNTKVPYVNTVQGSLYLFHWQSPEG
jgi:hypothetical protein